MAGGAAGVDGGGGSCGPNQGCYARLPRQSSPQHARRWLLRRNQNSYGRGRNVKQGLDSAVRAVDPLSGVLPLEPQVPIAVVAAARYQIRFWFIRSHAGQANPECRRLSSLKTGLSWGQLRSKTGAKGQQTLSFNAISTRFQRDYSTRSGRLASGALTRIAAFYAPLGDVGRLIMARYQSLSAALYGQNLREQCKHRTCAIRC